MTTYRSPRPDYLPEGAEVITVNVTENDKHALSVTYQVKQCVHTVIATRRDLIKELDCPCDRLFHHMPGMTFNFLYELLSTRHQLGLVKGEDYPDNDNLVPFQPTVYLPIHWLSLRFLPVKIPIGLVNPQHVFTAEESQRNLIGVQTNPFTAGLRKQLIQLGTHLIDGRDILCFEQDRLTVTFIQRLLDTAHMHTNALFTFLCASTIVGSMNDGLSDVVILSGPDIDHYLIRFISDENDLP